MQTRLFGVALIGGGVLTLIAMACSRRCCRSMDHSRNWQALKLSWRASVSPQRAPCWSCWEWSASTSGKRQS
jgi:hypothetical protein